MMDETPYFRRKYAFIIHWTHYLFSDWPKTYGEFSKSAPVTCQGHSRSPVIMTAMHEGCSWQVCALCIACQQWRSINMSSILIFVQCIIKQLDSVFVISRIIKVSIRIINLSLPLKTPTSTWLFWLTQNPHLIIVFLNIRSAISFWSTAIGSISAALSCPVYVPPRKARAPFPNSGW